MRADIGRRDSLHAGRQAGDRAEMVSVPSRSIVYVVTALVPASPETSLSNRSNVNANGTGVADGFTTAP
jgi:hypothetical protein